MPVTKGKVPLRAKSYTRIYDIFGSPQFDDLHNITKPSKNLSVFQATCGDTPRANVDSNYSMFLNSTPYITSEQYHLLNREGSFRSVVRSTSTIFYDLDDIAKRHSFNTLNEINSSNVNLLKVMKIPLNTNGFTGKSNAIVQECATQIKPRLLPRDSIEINTKKVKKSFPNDALLSSEILLRDDMFSDNKKRYYDKEITDRHQKFWSYAKYRTEYTNPIPEERKTKKKDRGKRTEDPCPCQLFSYACPCTDKKSLTELAKNSKSLTVADQITSTSKFQAVNTKESNNKDKKSKNISTKENRLSNTDYNGFEKYDIVPLQNETVVTVAANKHDVPTLTDKGQNESISNRAKVKSPKKRIKITCPKCRENVDVSLSTTDEEESLKYVRSSTYRIKEAGSKMLSDSRNNGYGSIISEDICNHQPRCELIPVCQILPTDHIYLNHKCIKSQLGAKSPKVIRITKACRHHPPCTVVPSCQRTNVLKNNCEYIPPCLHRPRCVNMPLCVPASKIFPYEDPVKYQEEFESIQCPHIPRCKYYPECQYDPMGSNMENQIKIVSNVQNTCKFLNDYKKPFVVNKKGNTNTPSPKNVASLTTCVCNKYNKSCQFDCTDCKCNSECPAKNMVSSEAIIFIRDVGCQFRNKKFSQKDSDQSKDSSTSFDLADRKMGNYYTNVHTLRYEDKCTNPVEQEDFSETSLSVTSYVDSQCPTHGVKSSRNYDKNSGFVPKLNVSPFIAYTTHIVPTESTKTYPKEINELTDMRTMGNVYGNCTLPIKSRRSFFKGKYKKMFSVKRRRKSRACSLINYSPLKSAYVQHA